MEIFKNLTTWVKQKISASKEKRQKRKSQNILNEIQETLQVMEFDGRLYVCYNGVPVVRVESLKSDVVKIVQQSRADLWTWKSQFKR